MTSTNSTEATSGAKASTHRTQGTATSHNSSSGSFDSTGPTKREHRAHEANTLGEHMRALTEEGRNAWKASTARMRDEMQERPLAALGAVFGLGLLIGGSVRSTTARVVLFGLAGSVMRKNMRAFGFGVHKSAAYEEVQG